ncbi:MAG: tryptophan-rich sensory protein [Candidatus Margulisbacteria bacterium]|nr:tryptophan-rich sensory protein [Candidatus Margulisiibacteriota bacterium]
MIKLIQIFNIISFIGMIIINSLANTLPINGKNTGEISDLYPNLFTPAGITFSIWGIIYLLLLCFVVFQSQGLIRPEKTPEAVKKIGWLFFLSCILNGSWIIAWHYQQIFLTLFIMILLLLVLVFIYRKLNSGLIKNTLQITFFTKVPFSVYLGWITVAAIANITVFMVSIHLDSIGIGGQFWTCLMIIIATIITLIVINKKRDIFYTLVIIWSLYGIIVKRIADIKPVNSIIYTAILAIIIICLYMFTKYYQTRQN